MQSLLFKLTVWLCTEVLLTCFALDDLADYGEYILRSQDIFAPQSVVPIS